MRLKLFFLLKNKVSLFSQAFLIIPLRALQMGSGAVAEALISSDRDQEAAASDVGET